MNYDKILTDIHTEAMNQEKYIDNLTEQTLKNIEIIAQKSQNQKGVFTVFVTLSIYKTIHPKQDIRNHQTQIKNGFSGRTIDTKYITPTLKRLGLPSMAESGWLTRTLEQPYPYGLDYEGKISNKAVKKAFLELVHAIEIDKCNPKYILVELFIQIIELQKQNQITIEPLANPEKLTITQMMNILDRQFGFKYKTFGGSKLPVLAFYSIYQILINEISRYKNCTLKELGSHIASDRASKSAGDIGILGSGDENKLLSKK